MRLFHAVLLLTLPAAATPIHLRTDHLTNPIGIDSPKPTFAWQSDATTPNWTQSAYQILIATTEANLAQPDIWDSHRITSSDSIDIPYAGPALKPQTRYFWQVRVWDNKNQLTNSTPAFFETGLLNPANWKAQWIRRADPNADRELASVHWLWLPNTDPKAVQPNTEAEFRYTLHLDAAPTRASLHLLAVGHFAATVNGTPTGQHTDFGAFDWEEITPLLKPGDNEILVKVISPHARQPATTVPAGFAASLRITAADNTERRLPSDTTWQARTANTPWQPAQEIGTLATPLIFANDRHSITVGPNRIASDAFITKP